MKIYLASKLSNLKQVQSLRNKLLALGHTITYDWTMHGSLQHSPEEWQSVARFELDGVVEADLVICLMPGGRGTHVELGAALAMTQFFSDSAVIVQGTDAELRDGFPYDCIFHRHPDVQRSVSEEQTLNLVQELAEDYVL